MLQNLLRNIMVFTALSLPMASLNAQSALADQRDFIVDNNNDLSIVRLHVSSANTRSWGPDRLGVSILPSGESHDVNFTNNSSQCIYDIRAIYEDGSSDTGRYNLCETSSVEFYGYGGDD